MLHAAHKALAVDRVAAVAVGLDNHRELRAARRAHRAQNAFNKPESICKTPTVLVCAQIFLRIQKVREQVSMRVVNLHTVRAAVFALFRRESKLRNQSVKFLQ